MAFASTDEIRTPALVVRSQSSVDGATPQLAYIRPHTVVLCVDLDSMEVSGMQWHASKLLFMHQTSLYYLPLG